MCKCASFIITKGPKVWWLPKSDSHIEIITFFKLHADGVQGPNTVAVEISPDGDNLSLPLATWKYKVDQDSVPEWYDAADCEKACRDELVAWAQSKLTGWNVKEAFNPINPLKLKTKRISKKKLLELLKQSASVGASVRASVGDSVWASVWVSVRDSVWDSVWASVGDSVWASVGASVGDSVWAYTGGLFPNITQWKYAEKLGPDPWRPFLTLWYAGYVPSFDGKTWRLHAGKDAKIVLEWMP